MKLGCALVLLGLSVPSLASAGGLYVRLGAGPGYSTGSDHQGGASADGDGVDASTEISVGTHLRPGLVVGGGEFSMAVPGPGHHLLALGPFVDHRMGRALHVQAAVMFVTGYHEAKGGFDASFGAGAGAMIGAGYDVWRGRRWELGPLVRVAYYHWSGGDHRLDQVSPSLLVALTYHRRPR